ncbi:hypothetical protein AWB78_01309 [Caballeronia calidae]|uniref:Uncharacterized protein n=1 Tax=Caballeronia calidae TaxID=1777139 RepID=A0A158A606_9BURK|nr:hypothetical protein [Caballeronia calidae]SAK53262.1 hypothetical protein AWB78_01309 [Caballeronia calidae]
MMERDEIFWLVWCPTGSAPPSYRHTSEAGAIAEAERLARAARNAKFYVLKATDLRYIDDMKRVVLWHPDEPIF